MTMCLWGEMRWAGAELLLRILTWRQVRTIGLFLLHGITVVCFEMCTGIKGLSALLCMQSGILFSRAQAQHLEGFPRPRPCESWLADSRLQNTVHCERCHSRVHLGLRQAQPIFPIQLKYFHVHTLTEERQQSLHHLLKDKKMAWLVLQPLNKQVQIHGTCLLEAVILFWAGGVEMWVTLSHFSHTSDFSCWDKGLGGRAHISRMMTFNTAGVM